MVVFLIHMDSYFSPSSFKERLFNVYVILWGKALNLCIVSRIILGDRCYYRESRKCSNVGMLTVYK